MTDRVGNPNCWLTCAKTHMKELAKDSACLGPELENCLFVL